MAATDSAIVKGTGVAAYATAAGQTIPGSASTVINYDTADTHNSSTDVTVTTGSTWKATANVAGWFQVLAEVNVVFGAGVAHDSVFFMRKNAGSAVRTGTQFGFTTDSIGPNVSFQLAAIVWLDAADYVDTCLFQAVSGNPGKSLTTTAADNFICIRRVG